MISFSTFPAPAGLRRQQSPGQHRSDGGERGHSRVPGVGRLLPAGRRARRHRRNLRWVLHLPADRQPRGKAVSRPHNLPLRPVSRSPRQHYPGMEMLPDPAELPAMSGSLRSQCLHPIACSRALMRLCARRDDSGCRGAHAGACGGGRQRARQRHRQGVLQPDGGGHHHSPHQLRPVRPTSRPQTPSLPPHHFLMIPYAVLTSSSSVCFLRYHTRGSS